MKLYFLAFTLLIGNLSYAETMKDKKTKEEMLARVDTLIQKSQEGRDAIEKEDVVLACQKINDIFEILPKHLMSIGTKMDLFDKDVIKMEKETKAFLIDIHMTSNICKSGSNAENLDIEEAGKKFKVLNKAFTKQKKRIKKEDTDFDNIYNYYYEF